MCLRACVCVLALSVRPIGPCGAQLCPTVHACSAKPPGLWLWTVLLRPAGRNGRCEQHTKKSPSSMYVCVCVRFSRGRRSVGHEKLIARGSSPVPEPLEVEGKNKVAISLIEWDRADYKTVPGCGSCSYSLTHPLCSFRVAGGVRKMIDEARPFVRQWQTRCLIVRAQFEGGTAERQ